MKTLDFSTIKLADTIKKGASDATTIIQIITQAISSAYPNGGNLEFHRKYIKVIDKIETALINGKTTVVELEDTEYEWLKASYKKLNLRVFNTTELSNLIVQLADIIDKES